jgi:multiple sugar transport system ATP-binding protein
MTVAENMAFGLQHAAPTRPRSSARSRSAADILQLDAADGPAAEGALRRPAPARRDRPRDRAEPEVFLFDEPLSNLDAALRVQTRLEIAKLHQRHRRRRMIYVTHDQVEAMTLADKIVLLRAGRGVQEQAASRSSARRWTLYHRPANLFVAEFIGSPKMNVMPASWSGPRPTTRSSRCTASS